MKTLNLGWKLKYIGKWYKGIGYKCIRYKVEKSSSNLYLQSTFNNVQPSYKLQSPYTPIPLYLFTSLMFALLFTSNPLKAQEDIHYNHIFSTDAYYNPSFAGINGSSSFSTNFTDSDFDHFNPGVYSFYFSYDTYLDSLRTGVGLIAYLNKIIPDNGTSSYIGAIYAPKFKLGKKFNLSPSLKPGYIHNRQNIVSTSEDTIAAKKDAFDLAAGLLLNSKRFYIGLSVDHLFEPRINYLDNASVSLKRKYIAQFGYHYAKNDTHGSFIHFNLLYQYQNNSYSLFASNYYVGKKTRYSFMGEEFFHRILFGAGYKITNDALSENGLFLGIGTQEKNLTIGLGFVVSLTTTELNVVETSVKYSFHSE